MSRIIITAEEAKFIRKRYIENESGAKIKINNNKYNKSTVTITGNETQCKRAKVLIKEAIEKAFIIPTIGIKLLELDNHNINDVNKAKFKFIKYEEEEEIVKPNNKNKYFIRLIKKIEDNSNNQESSEDELASLLHKKLDISPKDNGFVTSENLDACLNKICSQLSKTDPTDLSRRDVRLNLFFGREFLLFKNIEKEVFDVKEWINFDNGRRISSIFQQSAPQILEKMSILEKNFGFKEDSCKTASNDKNSIAIYFDNNSSKRKFKLHWDAEEGLWKITKCVRNINRIAILDSISGNEAPDYRFLLKTFYDIQIKPDLKDIINEIQSKSSFNSTRDEMWFRVKDFDNKLDKVEIRQTMTKRRFFNERFQISVVDIKQESADNKLSFQQTISLKNKSWRSVENIDQSPSLDYDEREISNTIRETVRYAREIVKVLS